MFVAWPLYVIHARAHRHLAGAGQRARHQGRVRVLGRACSTTCSTSTSRPSRCWLIVDRAGLRGRLLLPVPVRDPEVEPADAGPRGRGRGVAGDLGSRRTRVPELLPSPQARVVTPARAFAPGWVRWAIDGERIARRRAGPAAGPPTSTCPARRWCPASSTPTCTAAAGRLRRRRPGGGRHVPRPTSPHGTTTMIASLVTDAPDALTASCSTLAGSPTTGCSPASTSRARG